MSKILSKFLRGSIPVDHVSIRNGKHPAILLSCLVAPMFLLALVGKNGVGPWQHNELDAFLREFVGRGCPVIPVLLADVPREPALPVFLKAMTWVDFRKQGPEAMNLLIWGITGERIASDERAGYR